MYLLGKAGLMEATSNPTVFTGPPAAPVGGDGTEFTAPQIPVHMRKELSFYFFLFTGMLYEKLLFSTKKIKIHRTFIPLRPGADRCKWGLSQRPQAVALTATQTRCCNTGSCKFSRGK